MRIATRRAAGLDEGGWTDELRSEVEEYFDKLASDWHTRTSPGRTAIVADALDRGLSAMNPELGLAVEVGSGTGAYSHLLSGYFARVMAVDLSSEMLKRAPTGPAYRVLADGARLPLRDGAASAIALINAFLFPAEVARVLSARGVLLWVNSSGEQTPIHLSVDELVARLGGDWTGMSSRAGEGLWCAIRRNER
ncbi:MAG: class I SAM-dependent methyltransferase [Vicinamibacterales bacterium]|nr:class I SAM-dependent methyltransferase [Vicinamibacterales bacterium]